MAGTIKTSISIPKTLCDQVDDLARQLHISRSQLFGLAVEKFVRSFSRPDPDMTQAEDPNARPALHHSGTSRQVNQGDVYWIQLAAPSGIKPDYPHPYVVVQENILNHSRITTVVVCALTSNVQRGKSPGNVLLQAGEANLSRLSVVEVSKLSVVEKEQLGEYIGSLNSQRMSQIFAGIQFVQRMAVSHHEVESE